MRKFVLQCMSVVVGIGLLGATQAVADPVTVTGGHVTAQMTGGTFTLTGDGFSLSGAPPSGYHSGIWECTPCRASDRLNLSLSSSANGSFDDLPGEFDHVQYERTFLAGHLEFRADDMTSAILDAGQTSISMPFTFTGELDNYASFASRATKGSLPVFIATFSGSGIATAHFTGPFADPNGALFFADRITYDFAPDGPLPTPEPASLLLVGTGAAGLLARRRVGRNLRGPR
jgi:PEP-CTERM motif